MSGFNERYTDAGNARWFARTFGEHTRFVRERSAWFVNRGTHWAEDVDGEVMRFAKLAIDGIFKDTGDGRPREARDALLKHAMKSESAPRLQAALMLLQSEEGITIGQAELDADPMLLGVRNGVVNLRTGKFSASATSYITRRAGVDYAPHATCPTWMACLHHWLGGDLTLVDYLQRGFGYTLTGNTREQCFMLLHGQGDNGKSVLMATMQELLGTYAASASIGTFTDRRNDAATNDLAALAGVRLVCCSENNEGARLAEGLVKAVTGGEAVRARFLFREHFDYLPQFKLWLSTNHKPRVRGTDHAIWRRIRLIPFHVIIPEAEKDRDLTAKLRLELPGILNWAIAGRLAWQKHGLESPPAVVFATSAYRQEEDRIAQWIDERCETVPAAVSLSSTLYKAWSDERSEHPMT